MNSAFTFSTFCADLRQFMAHPPDELEDTFKALALRLFGLQYEANEPLRRLGKAAGAHPDDVRSLARIPAIPTAGFKQFEISCLQPQERTNYFVSSGTTGQARSRHFHSPASLALYEESLWAWFKPHLVITHAGNTPVQQLVCLSPPPAQAPHSSLVHMFDTVRRRLQQPENAFAGTCDAAGDWQIDLETASAVLKHASAQDRPVLLLGTAFSLVHLTDHINKMGHRIKLPAGSRVMETGGYKGRARELTRNELREAIVQRLGVPLRAIVSEYGMSELSSQAYDASPEDAQNKGDFRFPHWARVRIISPETGSEVPVGQTGLVQVIDLANVFSAMCIQTEDLGIRTHRGFQLVGRAPMAEPRGCSLMVTEQGRQS